MKKTDARIVLLGKDAVDNIVSTLCAAFRDYPVMRYILKEAERYDAQLTSLIAYFTDSRISRNYPVLGVLAGENMVAVANVNPARSIPAPPELEARFRRLQQELGDGAIRRFEAFARVTEPLQPEQPHYYLGMIGVRPEYQGKGYARLLLNSVHEMSAQDPESTGVALTTETPANLPLYEHFGYRVLGKGQTEELVTWTLFRPDPQ